MQQKVPKVPSNIKVQQPQSSSFIRKGIAANFFKTTFSSRSKAVPTATTFSVQETNKIGSAETKPVTRNRPRTVPQPETKIRRRNSERNLSLRTDKALESPRPLSNTSTTPDYGGTKTVKKDLSSNVLKIIRKAPAPPKPPPKTPDSLLPPSLKPKVPEKVKLKREKYVNNNTVWTNANVKSEKKIPLINIRGPSQGKQEATLKGAPSVSSLDSKHHKVAPAREKSHKIFGSKEKLHKAHKKKDLGNNNAVLEDPELREGLEFEDGQDRDHDYGSAEELGVGSVDERGSQECISLPVTLNADHMPGFQEVELRPRVPSEVSLTSGVRELESLRRELEASAMERAQLQARVDELLERANEADRLRAELERLKNHESEREAALERLADENGALRARLRGVAHSPLSDSEKRQLLLAPAPRRMHSSAPASIALAHNGEGDSGEASTPEWDKHSSSSLSEVSVACLQDRILQMEEHHYSTSEELQATLAELADLQSQLADAHADNERLADEKQVLLESLCRQTEKLEDSRTKVDTLQELLMREDVEPETVVPGDVDQQLFAVLKVSQEERRLLLSKQEQLEADLNQTKTTLEEKTKENETLTERIRSLELSVERAEAERCQWEQEAGAAREAAVARQQQIATLGDLLAAAQAQLAGAAEGAAAAEAAATAAARREADARAHALAERLAHAQRQLDRAHSDARKLHDDALVSRNTAKSTISELEFQLEQLRQEKTALQGELQTLQENSSELQIQVQVATDEKLALMSRAGEALARAADLERQLQDSRARLAQVTRDRERDEAEWKQFQSDLLMTVRVANDFKTEAQRELERLVSENKIARDRIRLLEDQMHSLKGVDSQGSMDSTQNYSDGKSLSKDSESFDSNSECSSIDVFKNIRSRYLSRVHSVNELPKVASLVDQAFYKSRNNLSQSDSDVSAPKELKLEIDNVTTDETNDDDSYKSSLENTDDYQSKVLAEAVLTPFESKGLKRQDALDGFSKKINRQDAVDDDNDADPINDDVNYIFRSESNNIKKIEKNTIFKKNLSNLFNGKQKSYSTDNLNVNTEFKNALNEATSIEFLDNTYNVSESSLLSEGSDSVFLSPLEKNNNVINLNDKKTYIKNINKTDNVKDIPPEVMETKVLNLPVVKAESILPFPYPDDISCRRKSDSVYDIYVQPTEFNKPYFNNTIENDFKKVNEELKVNFKAALDRISGNDKLSMDSQILDIDNNSDVVDTFVPVKRLSTFKGEENIIQRNESINSVKENYVIDLFEDKLVSKNNNVDEEFHGVKSSKVVNNIKDHKENNENVILENGDKNLRNNVNGIEVTDLNDPKTTLEAEIDDNVSYHLKINTVTDFDPPNVSAETRDNEPNGVDNNVKTTLTPLSLVNSNVDSSSSPIILSPVLIQPIFFQPNNAVLELNLTNDTKKGTVYYDDIDQVIAKDCSKLNEATKDSECKRKGIYQKNNKTKQLPFVSLKKFGSNENVMESKSSSPNRSPTKTVVRLSKTPEWLIDNQYYQPMQNVPFVINTAQTFVKEPKPIPKQELPVKRINSNPFISFDQSKQVQEQENYYEEIGEPISLSQTINVADDEKISNKTPTGDDFKSITREDILKVPRKPKRTKKHETTVPSKTKHEKTEENKPNSITKSAIFLSRTPSANDINKKSSGSVSDIVQSLVKNQIEPMPQVPLRKLSLQSQKSPNTEIDTGSLPRLRKTYHWKTLEHKRLSHPIRSLNDTSTSRPLRKLGFVPRNVPCDICECK